MQLIANLKNSSICPFGPDKKYLYSVFLNLLEGLFDIPVNKIIKRVAWCAIFFWCGGLLWFVNTMIIHGFNTSKLF